MDLSIGAGPGAESNAIAASNSEMAELKVCLRCQQAQLDAILTQLNVSRPQDGQRGGGNSSRMYRFQQDGKPICLRCNRAGHIAKHCRVEGGPIDVTAPRVPQRTMSHNQLVEQSMSLQPQGN